MLGRRGAGRRLLAGALLALAVACQAKSYRQSTGDGGGEGGGDAGAPCSCALPSGAGEVVIPCGKTGCADNVSYLCTDVGTALPGMLCGPVDAATGDGPVTCVTTCNGKTCNVPDSCGGLCKCAPGVQCNPSGICGNGCGLALGDVCSEDAGTSTACCSTGFACLLHDSGVSTCCATAAGGHCTQDTDCCDYPVLHCSTTAGTCG